MDEGPLERVVGAIRAHEFILQTTLAFIIGQIGGGPQMARSLRDIMADKFADAPPTGKSDLEREARINHFSAHFAEEFWTEVERLVALQNNG